VLIFPLLSERTLLLLGCTWVGRPVAVTATTEGVHLTDVEEARVHTLGTEGAREEATDLDLGRILHDDATILPVVVPTHPVVVPTRPADTKEHDDTEKDLKATKKIYYLIFQNDKTTFLYTIKKNSKPKMLKNILNSVAL